MNITVCVKLVEGELNPFDACALEAALQMDSAAVTVLAMGPPAWQERLRTLTRYPVDDVILLSDPAFSGADTLATSYTLSLAVKRLKADLVLCGRQSIDGDTAQVGPCLSQLLGYGLHTNVMGIEGKRLLTRMGEEVLSLPAVLTIERINTLRFFSIRSKARPLQVWSAAELGADVSRCGQKGSPTVVVKSFENRRSHRDCQWSSPDQLPALLAELKRRKCAKEIEPVRLEKLARVYTIGEAPVALAKTIADDVLVLPPGEPNEMAEQIRTAGADVVLWPADLWGRKNAPRVAAILQTGLCADCTRLEAENGELYFYRPARGGNITAKIKCRTLPKMATVRTAEESQEIVVAAGRGAAACIEQIQKLASALDAEFGASRGLVDQGAAPYESQIGLTGRMVAPSVYLAVGISGAVQHMCAVSGAGTIIAVNPDRDAPVFRYADYGVIADAASVCRIAELEAGKQ